MPESEAMHGGKPGRGRGQGQGLGQGQRPLGFCFRTLLACSLLASAGGARATTFIPMRIEDLARSSAAAVIGTVQAQRSVRSWNGEVYTLVTVAVEQVLRGTLRDAVIILKEDGGRIGSIQEVEFGAPRFATGEHVLLFLTLRPDGSWRTNHLALGKFDLAIDRSGMPQARQRFDAGTSVLLPPGVSAPRSAMPLGEVLSAIASTGGDRVAPAAPLAAPPEANDPSLLSEVSTPFTLEGGRFFEADEGTPLSFLIDQSGDAILGLPVARQAVDDAFTTWSTVSSATIHLQDTGLTGDLTAPCPGPHVIIFNDPMNAIPPPESCTGMLALGGYCSSNFESKHFGGRTFDRALRAKVTFANGWDGCAVWTECNVAEIATHEIGHAIGLGHSSERNPEPDPLLSDATMYYRAHFDGRCAGIRADDSNAVSFLYPTPAPLTIVTPDPLPNGVAGDAYSEPLTATGSTSALTWTVVSGGFPGLSVSPDGRIVGTPTATGTTFFQVKATDVDGNSHTKVLYITVVLPTPGPSRTPSRTGTPTRTPTIPVTPTATSAPATPTTTPTPSAIPSSSQTPTATPTDTPTSAPTLAPTDSPTPRPSLTPTPAACTGDCDASGDVTINELLTMVNIALDNIAASACPAGDRNHDSAVTVDEILAAVNTALNGCPVTGVK